MISCSIRGEPRMIHTKVRVRQRRGENLLMEPKHTTSPNGMEKTSVNMKTLTVSPKPPRSWDKTCMNINAPHKKVVEHGGEPP